MDENTGHIHEGVHCDACGMMPLKGIRFKCGNCIDFDLCQNCIGHRGSYHPPQHCFLYIDKPVPGLVMGPTSAPFLVTSPFAEKFIVFDIGMEPSWYSGLFGSTSIGFQQLLKQQDGWVAKSAGTESGSRILDPNVRNCRVWIKGIPNLSRTTLNFCEPFIQTVAHDWYGRDKESFSFQLENTELLLYTPGGHFLEHEDREIFGEGEQLGTLLLIGYSQDSKGGELVSDQGQDIVSVQSSCRLMSSNFRWKGCILQHKAKHSVKRLESGLRVVFKATVRMLNRQESHDGRSLQNSFIETKQTFYGPMTD